MKILGVKVDNYTYAKALERSKELLESGKKHYIVTPNPEIIVAAQKDKELQDILNRADLSIADGSGLVKLANLTERNIPERITGVDFVQGLAGIAEEFGYSVFFLGGQEGVAQAAAENLKKTLPKLKIAGAFPGKADEKFDDQTVSRIKSAKVDIIILAFGHGKQEKWIKRNLPKLNVNLAIGVGGALDYISGRKKRAPRWVQKAGMEWFYRLIMEPWRLKRQLALPHFVYLIVKEGFFQKKNPS
ncbi:MAG: WecB/TagA/CpsF family glycosyltransferase [Candidatus Woykebacteria bacterium]